MSSVVRPRKSRWRRLALVTLILVLVLSIAAIVGLRYAAGLLKEQIETALGENSEVAAIEIGWSGIEIQGLRIRAPRDWPAKETLHAERITVVPDLRGLLSDRSRIRIQRITVDNPYLSVLRSSNGKLRLLPSLLEAPRSKEGKDASMPVEVILGKVELRGGRMEFFDASIRRPAHRIALEELHIEVENLQVPSLSGRTALSIAGTIKGVRRDGKLASAGWMEIADKNSRLDTRLSGIDLLVLQPYLIKATETGVKRGTLDLQLQSTLKKNQLHAPGTLTLKDLELREKGGAMSTFMGLPRQAVLTGLKDNDNRITVRFTLEGNLNDPRFSLNESFAKSIGTATAGLLGISIEGLAKQLGNAPQAIGSTLRSLFGD